MKPLSITFLILLSLVLVFNTGVTGDSENVEMLGRIYNQWDSAYDVVVLGEYAYVATGVSGLQIVNISNPEVPEIVGFYDDNKDWARNVAISGDYAYVTFGTDSVGLLVLNISDPTNPEFVSEYFTEGYPNGISVSGNYAYIANSGNDVSELHIVNISNPTEPQEAATYENLTRPNDIVIEGDQAFVADYEGGLKILNISDIENIQEVGISTAPQTAVGVFVIDNYSYVANSRNGLCIIEISDPENPDSIGSCATDGGIEKVYIDGDYCYTAGRDGLGVIDVSDRTAPEVVSTMNMGLSKAYDLFVVDTTAFIADGRGSMWTVNVANPAEPDSIGCTLEHWGDANDVVYTDYYMYAAFGGGLRIIDITSLENPHEVGMILTGGDARAVAKPELGSYIYVADGDSGLVVIDVLDPENPTKVAALSTFNYANDITILGDVLYLVNGRSLGLIDISNPESPQILGTYDAPMNANCVSVSRNIAYISDSQYLHIVDVTNPESPDSLNVIEIPGQIGGVDSEGHFVYLTHYNWEDNISTMRIFDIEDPQNPTELSSVEVLGIPEGICFCDWIVYVTGGVDMGLQIFLVDNPEEPELFGYYDTPGYPKNATKSIPVGSGMVIVADRTNIGIYEHPVVGVKDEFNASLPDGFALLPAYPNPFNAVTNISFELPYPSDVSLKVYDISGRSVASVFNGSQTVGVHSLLWNAENHPSGVYFIRMEAYGFSLEQRVMLVK
ncbi:T9SS type A sorting domain-containing protein [bacterium]|nr:T9SS type A sorting domain-containing protein [bacterium]